jgi:hypothetical protein
MREFWGQAKSGWMFRENAAIKQEDCFAKVILIFQLHLA